MINVQVDLDDSLKFFIEKKNKTGDLHISFGRDRSVKDLLESLGIPHVELGAIYLNGNPVPPDHVIRADCSISVLGIKTVRDEPCGMIPHYFILDVHLGKLAVNLRMLGIEADYSNDRDDPELAELASEKRNGGYGVLLSCDRGLLMRSNIRCGMVVRSRESEAQAVEVIRRFRLVKEIKPFTRCFNCGGLLYSAGDFSGLSEKDKQSVPVKVRSWCSMFTKCTDCGQLYWEGSHFEKMREKVVRILNAAGLNEDLP